MKDMTTSNSKNSIEIMASDGWETAPGQSVIMPPIKGRIEIRDEPNQVSGQFISPERDLLSYNKTTEIFNAGCRLTQNTTAAETIGPQESQSASR